MEKQHTTSSFLSRLESVKKLPIPEMDKGAALGTICKILGNIIENPTEDKYRSINRTSNSYVTKILRNGSDDGVIIEDLLLECGFGRYKSHGKASSRSDSSDSSAQSTLELLPTVSLEDLHEYRSVLLRELGGEGSLAAAADRPAVQPSLPRKKNVVNVQQQREEELKQLREAQARKYESYANSSSPNERNLLRNKATPRNNTTGGSRRSRVSDLVCSVFRCSRTPETSGRPPVRHTRTMTLRDLPQPQGPRCCR